MAYVFCEDVGPLEKYKCNTFVIISIASWWSYEYLVEQHNREMTLAMSHGTRKINHETRFFIIFS